MHGFARLALLAVVIAAAVAVISAVDDEPRPPTAAEKAAELRKIEQARQRKEAERLRDPTVRRELARLKREQKAHFGSGRPGLGSRPKQEALVAALERSVTRDAQARFAAKELNKQARDTVCVHLVRPNTPKPPPPPLDATEAGYECTAVTNRVGATSRTKPVIVGFPFWARVNFRTGRFAWCKVNLLPSEGGIGGSLAEVPLPPICDVLGDQGPA
jgi:hypothetical protein